MEVLLGFFLASRLGQKEGYVRQPVWLSNVVSQPGSSTQDGKQGQGPKFDLRGPIRVQGGARVHTAPQAWVHGASCVTATGTPFYTSIP